MKQYTITIDGDRIYCEDGLGHMSVAIRHPDDEFSELTGAYLALSRCEEIKEGDDVILMSNRSTLGMWDDHIRYMLYYYDQERHAFPKGYIDRVVRKPSEVRENAHYVYDGEIDKTAFLIDKVTRKIVLVPKTEMIHA